jgi:4-amino-4-deoxy-L-arabinose transferase-like glycosyltransferase
MLNDTKIRIPLIIGVLLLSAISAGWTLSARSFDNHECFVSVTAREMLQNGDWVMPTFNDQPRLQKTPLSYWLVAAIAKVTGKVDEFAARLPSVVFAVLSVCAIIYFVSQWLSFRTAIISAGVWATSLGYVRLAHNARAEMVMTFFTTVCFLSFYSAITENSRRKQIVYMLAFWVSFGLANLAKGPAPIPLVLVPLFVYVAVFRQWKKVPRLLPIAGALIFLAIVLPWPLAIAHRVNWDLLIWKREFVDRFFGEYAKGDYPIYYYFLIMFKYATPWVVFLPMALAAPFFRIWGRKRPVMFYLWILFVTDFAFLMLSEGKRQHYIMPIMPALAILTGILIEDMIFIREAYTARQARQILSIHIAAAFLISAGMVIYCGCAARRFLPAATAMACVGVAGAAAVGVLFANKRPGLACTWLFVWLAALIMVDYVGFVIPLDDEASSKRFATAVSQKVPSAGKLVAYKHVSENFINYFGRPVPVVQTESEADSFYQKGCWIIAFGGNMDELLKTERFELVFTDKILFVRHREESMTGGLFHRKQPEVKNDSAGLKISPEVFAAGERGFHR